MLQTGSAATFDSTTLRKIQLHLLPFLFALYVVAFVDRINIGFAALTMNRELAITSRQFGLVAGIFFWGYFLFEIPSNLALQKIGARIWIARVLLSWGIVATLTGLVRTPVELYLARFLLGLAEAGFFPGIVLYLSYWFPQREKAYALAILLTGQPVASILGGPISGVILDRVHWFGLSSWRWLLVLEGAPAIVFGVMAYFLLPNRPTNASFLSDQEKDAVERQLRAEELHKESGDALSSLRVLIHPRVLHLAATGFCHAFGAYTFIFWLPQILASLLGPRSNTLLGFALALPYLAALFCMVVVSRHSDRTGARRLHMALPIALSGVGLLSLIAVGPHLSWLAMALLMVVAMGVYSFLPVYFSAPTEFLSGYPAAVGIALITSVANLGGFAGPYLIGMIRQSTGSLNAGLAVAGGVWFISAALASLLPKAFAPEDAPRQAAARS